jgi:hypothetical protein
MSADTTPDPDANHWPEGTSVLHVFGQDTYHAPVAIVGTREGLGALRDAITRALDTGEAAAASSMAKDGEHYAAVVVPVTVQQMEEVPLAYIEDDFGDRVPSWLSDAIGRAAREGE